MIGLGTVINVAGVLLGGIMGMLCGRMMSDSCQNTLIRSAGVCVLFVGLSGALEKMMTVSGGALHSGGTMMLIVSMAAGSLIGERLDIESLLERFGAWLKRRCGSGESRFIEGFVSTSLTICIGAMAIVGSIQDGISGDHSTLVTKAILDFIIVWVMTASLGRGCIFSAIPVGLFQGTITLLARAVQPLMTEETLGNISLVGSVLIFCVGVNLVWDRRLKVANMLPAVVIAAAWALL